MGKMVVFSFFEFYRRFIGRRFTFLKTTSQFDIKIKKLLSMELNSHFIHQCQMPVQNLSFTNIEIKFRNKRLHRFSISLKMDLGD